MIFTAACGILSAPPRAGGGSFYVPPPAVDLSLGEDEPLAEDFEDRVSDTLAQNGAAVGKTPAALNSARAGVHPTGGAAQGDKHFYADEFTAGVQRILDFQRLENVVGQILAAVNGFAVVQAGDLIADGFSITDSVVLFHNDLLLFVFGCGSGSAVSVRRGHLEHKADVYSCQAEIYKKFWKNPQTVAALRKIFYTADCEKRK